MSCRYQSLLGVKFVFVNVEYRGILRVIIESSMSIILVPTGSCPCECVDIIKSVAFTHESVTSRKLGSFSILRSNFVHQS